MSSSTGIYLRRCLLLLAVCALALPLGDQPAEPLAAAAAEQTREQGETLPWLPIDLGPSRKGAEVQQIVVGPSGALWVLTNLGVSRLSQDEVEHLAGLPEVPAFALAAAPSGVAVATQSGLFWFDDHAKARARPLVPGIRIGSVVFHEGRLWYLPLTSGESGAIGWIDPISGRGKRFEEAFREAHVRGLLPAGPKHLLLYSPLGSQPLDVGASPPAQLPSVDWQALATTRAAGRTFALTRDAILELRGKDSAATLLPKVTEGRGALAATRDETGLWLVRQGSALLVDLHTGRFRRELAVPASIVPAAAVEDGWGRLWIGGRGGLWMTDPARVRLLCSSTSDRPAAATAVPAAPGSMGTTPRTPEELPKCDPLSVAGFTAEGGVWLAGPKELVIYERARGPARRMPLDERGLDARVGTTISVQTWRGAFRHGSGGWEPLLPPLPTDGITARLKVLDADDQLFKLLKSRREIHSRLLKAFSDADIRDMEKEDLLHAGLVERFGREAVASWLESLTDLKEREHSDDPLQQWTRPELVSLLTVLERRDKLLKALDAVPEARSSINATFSRTDLEQWERRDLLLDRLRGRFQLADLTRWVLGPPHRILALGDSGSVYLLPRQLRGEQLVLATLSGSKTLATSNLSPREEFPDIQAIVRSGPAELLALTEEGGLLVADIRRLSSRRLPESYGGEKLLVSSGHALALEEGRLWRMSPHKPWQAFGPSTVPARSGRPRDRRYQDGIIGGLVEERGGRSVLAGCWDCGEQNLFRLTPDGKTVPAGLAGIAKVGAVNDALYRDSQGRIWASSAAGVHVSGPGIKGWRPVRTAQGKTLADRSVFINHIFEDPDGRIWLAGSPLLLDRPSPSPLPFSALWVIRRPGEPPEPVGNLETESFALGWSGGPAGRQRLWLGGMNLLLMVDPATLATEDRSAALAKEFRAPSPRFAVLDLEGDGKAVLAGTDKGLFRATLDRIEDVTPELWPAQVHEVVIERLGDGRLLLAAGTFDGQMSGQSRIWMSDRDGKFNLVTNVPVVIHAAAEAFGHVLLSGNLGQILALDPQNGEIRFSRTVLPGRDGLEGPLRSACHLAQDKYLVLGQGGRPYLIEAQQPPALVSDLLLPPWRECIPWGEAGHLLLHSAGVSLVKLEARPSVRRISFAGESLQRLFALAHPPTAEDRPPESVYALGEKGLWQLDPRELIFRKRFDLPPQVGSSRALSLAVDQRTAMVGAAGAGLLVYSLESGGFKVLDVVDGLPSTNIQAILPEGRGSFLVVTSEGLVRARSAGTEWTFEISSGKGLSGAGVQSAELLRIDGAPALAVATANGVDIVHWKEGDEREVQEKGTWLHLDRDSGLPSADVKDLHWFAERGELWAITPAGATVLNIEVASPDSFHVTIGSSLTEAGGLPRGTIREVSLSRNGLDAWLLVQTESGQRIVRWDRRDPAKPRLVASEPFFPGDGVEVRLEPRPDGRLPQLLLRDQRSWSLWSPIAYPQLRLEAPPALLSFLVAGQWRLDSLDPKDDAAVVHARYGLDGMEDVRSWRFFLAPNLVRNRSHVMLAEAATPTATLRASARVPEVEEHVWWIRLILLLGASLVLLGTLGWQGWRRAQSSRKLRARLIPYIQGEVIQDPAKFFGRQALIERIRDNIANQSFALVGAFRIGKTSIQRQLTLLFERMSHPNHIFLPVYVDLQYLSGDKNRNFFYFLGQHMVELARDQELSPEEVAGLEHGQAEEPGDYDAMAFAADVDTIIEGLKPRCAPRNPIIVLQIDEISLMADLSDDVRLGFRAAFIHQPLLKTVMSGVFLPKEQESSLSRWWNFIGGGEIEVEPLGPEEARELIERPVRGMFSFDDEVIERIIARAQGRPLDLQEICAHLLAYKYRQGRLRRRITMRDLQGSLNDPERRLPERTENDTDSVRPRHTGTGP